MQTLVLTLPSSKAWQMRCAHRISQSERSGAVKKVQQLEL